jgi:hypothetical protein
MRWTSLVALVGGLAAHVLVGAARAEDPVPDAPVDGPGRIFRDDLLENLVGDWKIERKFADRTSESRMTATWVLNHQFLELRMKDVADPPAYEAIVLIGFVHAEKTYVAHWCDSFGGAFSSVGRAKRDGDRIPFVFPYPHGPFHNTFAWDAAAKTWTFRMETEGEGGKRAFFAEDTLRRP